MSKQVWKGSALVAPVPPALVSCGTLEAPNVLTVAWTGMLQSQPPKTYGTSDLIRTTAHAREMVK